MSELKACNNYRLHCSCEAAANSNSISENERGSELNDQLITTKKQRHQVERENNSVCKDIGTYDDTIQVVNDHNQILLILADVNAQSLQRKRAKCSVLVQSSDNNIIICISET